MIQCSTIQSIAHIKETNVAKPCRICGLNGHSTTFCWSKKRALLPQRPGRIKSIGKQATKWIKYRAEWFTNNPPNKDGFYVCYICGDNLTPKETTLDHIIPRSARPDLKYVETNIKPCCYKCNSDKGSKH